MASLPALASGLPTIEPTAGAAPYQRIDAPVEAFGGGRGLERLGKGLEQAGMNFLAAQETFDNVAADEANTQFRQRVSTLLNGDPNQQIETPEGPMPDSGYMGTRGRVALDQRKTIEQKIAEYQNEIANGLKSPLQKQLFAKNAERYKLEATGKISNHADNETKTWYSQVLGAKERQALHQVAANPESATDFAEGLRQVTEARVRAVQVHGGTQEQVSEAIQTAQRDTLKTKLEAMAINNPAGALEELNQTKLTIGPFYDELALKFRTRADEQIGNEIAEKYWNEATTAAQSGVISPSAPLSEDIHTAIINQESGGNPNAPTSVAGARGIGQIMPETFARYAKPGESIDNPRDNEAVSRRITDDLYRKFNGDPARVAVAYFSGEGNVAAPDNPNPWRRDVADKTGKTVSSYVSDVIGRLGESAQTVSIERIGQSQRDAIANARIEALEKIEQDKSLSFGARRNAIAQITQRFQIASIQQLADEKRRKDAEEASASQYVNAIIKGDVSGLSARLANDPTITSTRKQSLFTMMESTLKSDVDADTKTYGTGFYDVWRRVHSPQGDPNRITDPTVLYGMVGPNGPLTVRGVEKLTQEILGKRTPDGEAESDMKKQFFANAKSQISGANALLGIKDPKGEEQYLKFMAYALPEYDAGRKNGKTPSQLLNPDSPDYIGKSIKDFQRSMAQINVDMEEAALGMNVKKENEPADQRSTSWLDFGEAAKYAEPVKEPDLSTPEGLKQAVDAGKISRQEGIRIGIEKGWIKPPSQPPIIPPGVSVPVR